MLTTIIIYTIPTIIGILFGSLVGYLSHARANAKNHQQAENEQQSALKDGMLALLHDRIYGECASCESHQGVTLDALRNLEYLYEPYHALGGNGTGTILYERVKNLPVIPAERGQL